jgi:hypothetical protein
VSQSIFPRPVTGAPPTPLQWAIAEFRVELRRFRRSVPGGEQRGRATARAGVIGTIPPADAASRGLRSAGHETLQ